MPKSKRQPKIIADAEIFAAAYRFWENYSKRPEYIRWDEFYEDFLRAKIYGNSATS